MFVNCIFGPYGVNLTILTIYVQQFSLKYNDQYDRFQQEQWNSKIIKNVFNSLLKNWLTFLQKKKTKPNKMFVHYTRNKL